MDRLRAGNLFSLATASLALAACSASSDGTGRISISVSDHPMHDVTKVCVAFSEVELKPKEGPSILAENLIGEEAVVNVNLLEYQGMNAAPLLMDYEVPAGEYLWIRLGVNADRGGTAGSDDAMPESPDCQGADSYLVTMDTTPQDLYIPSGEETGLKLHGSIIIPHGGEADFTAEIDLMKSVAFPNGMSDSATFRPTLKLVNNLEVGAVTGQVANDLIDGVAECSPTVYIFEDDMMDAALDVANSLTSTMVEAQGSEYHYTIGFLLEGMYELAFSCDDGATLVPENGKPVTIEAGTEPAVVPIP